MSLMSHFWEKRRNRMEKMKMLGEKETFKNSCVIYRRKMTLAFAFPSPWETVQYSFEPGAKKKALQQLQWVLYTPLLDGTKWSRAQLAAAAVWLSPSPTRMKRIPYSQFQASQKREIARERERVSCSPCCNLIVCHKLCVYAAKGTW